MPDDYYVSQYSGEEIDERLTAAHNAVRYDAAQTLTDEQKTQARGNIAAAPDGFGLGTVSATVSNADDAVINGWYKIPAPTGFGAGQLWCMVSTLASIYITQTLYTDHGGGGVAMRFNIGGTWQPWEWVNPPMHLGVEYRTTERYMGKPVYTQIIDCGSIPAIGSGKTISIDAFNVGVVTLISGWCTYYGSVIEPNIFGMALSANNGGIRIVNIRREVNSNAVMYTLVKYTKKTD